MLYEFSWDGFDNSGLINWNKVIYFPERDSFAIYSSSLDPDFLVVVKSFGLISTRFRVGKDGKIDFTGGHYKVKDLTSGKTHNLNLSFDSVLSLDKHIISRYLLANSPLTDLRIKEKGIKISPYTISFKCSSISEPRVFIPTIRLDIDFLRCENDIMCRCPGLYLREIKPERILDLYTFVANNIEIKDVNGVSVPLRIVYE